MRIAIPPPPTPFLDLTNSGGLAAVLPSQSLRPYESSDVNAWFFAAFSPNGTDTEVTIYLGGGALEVEDCTLRLEENNGTSLGQLHYLSLTVCRKPGSTGAIAANTVIVYGRAQLSCSCDASTEVITSSAHGLRDGDVVQFTGTLPSGISAATDYIVRDRTRDTFKVTATLGGSAVNFTTAGTNVVAVPRQREIARLQVLAAAAGDEPVADYLRLPCVAGHKHWTDSSAYPLIVEFLNSDVDLEVRILGVGES